eukprot:CAMPEP_0204421232 /NCGR_PEP_ID=MMETSP0470-20130426/34523_1 /ASSEMBLY_ACC=CAM_ASM_000385 /TAXON_ID=2969 /ORGANISM="Oxyrrhis marina" /LENGTH=49 /DNA_ID=CAMNT_0051418323 /DNA_START=214 /DNA_END=363 /DNA_ORIENTATION=+
MSAKVPTIDRWIPSLLTFPSKLAMAAQISITEPVEQPEYIECMAVYSKL